MRASSPRIGAVLPGLAFLPGLMVAALASLAAPATASTLLYSNDFDAPAVTARGVTAVGFTNGTIEPTANGPVVGSAGSWAGNYFDNRSNPPLPSLLTLPNLPSHSAISIGLILGFLESWDSADGSPSPDYLKFEIDGNPILVDLASNNASGSIVNFGGGSLLGSGQFNTNFFFSDRLIDMATAPSLLSIAHTSSTLTLGITAYGAGWQGGGDEGWGIDALSITYVPAGGTGEPSGVPGPLPLLGAAAAFRFSRKIRQRLALAARAGR